MLGMMAGAAARGRWRVGVIGHTGRGNYGHGLDTAFAGLEDAEIVAVADAGKAGVRYVDYREMLRVERPGIVAIGPRWLDQRVEMIEACAAVGAHVLMEKAFAATLEDGDRCVRALGGLKCGVCHTARLEPGIVEAVRLIREGAIGEVLEMRARGKEDGRAGGEDMAVLGTHCFDLMRMVAGDPVRCWAQVTGPRREATEWIGPVAGDAIAARFEFGRGVMGHFASQRNSGPAGRRYGVTVYGSEGAIDLPLGEVPVRTWIVRSASWRGEWAPVAARVDGVAPAQRMARDLIEAIERDRAPACAARDGLWTVEMVQAVYASSMKQAAVELPLKARRHPLM